MSTTTTTSPDFKPLTGACICGSVQYKLLAPPLVIHCCHCTWCQRETGTACAINLIVEAYNFSITSSTQPVIINAPSASSPEGKKHLTAHCPKCYTGLYGHYGGHKYGYFVKAGTLDAESRAGVRPSAHIFTSTKMDWVDLSKEKEAGIQVFEAFYSSSDNVWSKESLERKAVWTKWIKEQKVIEKTEELKL